MVALLHVLVLALLGLPLFIVIGLAAALGYASVRPEPLHPKLLFTDAYQQIATQPLFLTIPLFTFAGYLLSESRAPVRLVALSRAWLGWVPGGISVVVVLVSCLFTAITGASGVTIIALGGLLLPILLRDGHPDRFSVGLVTTCGSMGLLFPPSLPIIIYAVIAGPVTSKTFQKHGLSGGAVDIDRLFRAGLLPGLLMVAVLAAWCVWVARRTRPEREPFRGGEALRALRAALPELAIPAIILGGIYGGLGTTADVSAVTALYVFAVEVLLYRDIRPSQVPGIVHRSMVLVGAILVIMIASLGLTNYLSDQQVPERILATLGGRIADPGAARAAARALEEAGRPLAASPVLSARATRRSCKAAARSLDEAALGLEWGLGALAARAGLEGVAVLAGPGVPPATGDMAEALGGETGEGVPARSAALAAAAGVVADAEAVAEEGERLEALRRVREGLAWLKGPGAGARAPDLEAALAALGPLRGRAEALAGLGDAIRGPTEAARAVEAEAPQRVVELQLAPVGHLASALEDLRDPSALAGGLRKAARGLPEPVRSDLEAAAEALSQVDAAQVGDQDLVAAREVERAAARLDSELYSARLRFLVVLNVFLLVVGCLMDIFSAILVVVPIIVPMAIRFGVDPIHLGVIFLANLQIGYSTPPVGMNLFIASLRFRRPVISLYGASMPFLVLLLVALAVITYVPGLSLWLAG